MDFKVWNKSDGQTEEGAREITTYAAEEAACLFAEQYDLDCCDDQIAMSEKAAIIVVRNMETSELRYFDVKGEYTPSYWAEERPQ